VAGPQFYGGPDLQRAGFWRAWGRIEGLQESPPFMTTRPSHNIINMGCHIRQNYINTILLIIFHIIIQNIFIIIRIFYYY
jgi:hypothetical protein